MVARLASTPGWKNVREISLNGESVPLGAVIDESGFEARLDSGNYRLVNVALFCSLAADSMF
jgi:hypothetical protein